MDIMDSIALFTVFFIMFLWITHFVLIKNKQAKIIYGVINFFVFILYFFINFYIYRENFHFHLLIVSLIHVVILSFVLLIIKWGGFLIKLLFSNFKK